MSIFFSVISEQNKTYCLWTEPIFQAVRIYISLIFQGNPAKRIREIPHKSCYIHVRILLVEDVTLETKNTRCQRFLGSALTCFLPAFSQCVLHSTFSISFWHCETCARVISEIARSQKESFSFTLMASGRPACLFKGYFVGPTGHVHVWTLVLFLSPVWLCVFFLLLQNVHIREKCRRRLNSGVHVIYKIWIRCQNGHGVEKFKRFMAEQKWIRLVICHKNRPSISIWVRKKESLSTVNKVVLRRQSLHLDKLALVVTFCKDFE